MSIIEVEFQFKLPYTITKKRKWYLASCPVLDVHSQGETKEKAKTNLREALIMFINSCFERGTLNEVLKEFGFVPVLYRETIKPSKKKLSPKYNYLNIPLPMAVDQSKTITCHA